MTPEEEEQEIQERYQKDKEYIDHLCCNKLPCVCFTEFSLQKKKEHND